MEVTLRGTLCPLRALARKPQKLTARPMPFRLGKHFEIAILVRVHQGHHGHTAQCCPGGGEALRLERIEAPTQVLTPRASELPTSILRRAHDRRRLVVVGAAAAFVALALGLGVGLTGGGALTFMSGGTT